MKKTSKEKNPKKTEKPGKKVPVELGSPQGFLLPESHKMAIQWKVNPIFRATFLLLLLTLLYGITLIPRWIFTQEWEKATSDLSQTSLEESDWISASLAKIRPIRAKYQKVEEILQYRRIPLSPILSSIQKNIPKEISLTKLFWESDLNKTTDNIKISGRKNKNDESTANHTNRTARLKLNIYATSNWNQDRSPAGWLANVEKAMATMGIEIKERNIGDIRPYQSLQKPDGTTQKGSTLEVTLGLQLKGAQERDTTPKGQTPIRPPQPTQPNFQNLSLPNPS